MGLHVEVGWLPTGSLLAGGRSIEEAARDHRLRFLSQVASEKGFTCIALGHQADDVAETVLMRLLRGCGIHGLAAVRPSLPLTASACRLVRPLLPFRREQLRAYLRRSGCGWREDSSNADPAFLRNRVRHTLLPAMVSRSGASVDLLSQLNEAAAGVDDLLQDAIDRAWQDACRTAGPEEIMLDVDRLNGLAPPVRTGVLRRAAGRPDRKTSQRLQRMIRAAPGARLTLPGGRFVRREHGILRFAEGTSGTRVGSVNMPVPGTVELPALGATLRAEDIVVPPGSHAQWVASAGPLSVFVSAEHLGRPLTVRTRRPGDRFHPLGAPGARKLKDFFIGRRSPFHVRDRTPLVVAPDGEIAWVVGHEIGHRFRLTGAERKIVHLSAG
jgi:tRNA(Ile)-lysidine synthase